MFEYVKNYNLIPKRPYTKRAKTDLAVLHMVGGTMTVQDIHEMHKNDTKANYSGIAYNIYVDKDGTTIWGRGLDYEGGHVANGDPKTKGVNARSVGIVCNGNFMKEKMCDAQKEALKRIVADVVRYYNFSSISQIVTHREIAGRDHTDCPGDNFPIDEIREYIRQGAPAKQTEKDPMLWKVTVNDLNFRAAPGGKILKVLHRNDTIYLQRYVKGEDWARVRLGGPDGQEGYVWLKYIGEK